MAWKPDNDRATPPQGLPEPTGYARHASLPIVFAPQPPPAPAPKKTVFEQLKDVGPIIVVLGVLASVIGSWKDTKADIADLKKSNEERKLKDAQRDADAEAAKKSAAAAFGAAADAAKQTRDQGLKLNEVLRRLNITRHRAPKPPEP
jgi:hypothetical protein